MKKLLIIVLSFMAYTTSSFGSKSILDSFKNTDISGQIRVGHVSDMNDNITNAIGATLGMKTNAVNGLSVGATFYTTHAIAGKDKATEFTFLDSNNDSYSILGEAYLEANRGNTIVKVGCQIIDTPYANSDDIGMVPNTFEAITVVNNTIPNTTITLMSLNKMSGVDATIPENFSDLQTNGDAVKAAGIIYDGLENISLQAWSYDISDDNVKYNYFEVGYKTDLFSLAVQKSTQGNGNFATGIMAIASLGDLELTVAKNDVKGTVSNGFGGGSFFTSSEDHTIADTVDQKAVLVGAEYSIGAVTMVVNNVKFDVGEDETDYLLGYAINDNLSADFIFTDMNTDGRMTRVFINYNF